MKKAKGRYVVGYDEHETQIVVAVVVVVVVVRCFSYGRLV
jgi:hypothetical protein